jgi:hypothetical protein
VPLRRPLATSARLAFGIASILYGPRLRGNNAWNRRRRPQFSYCSQWRDGIPT